METGGHRSVEKREYPWRASAETPAADKQVEQSLVGRGILGNFTVFFKNRDGNTKGSCSFNSETVRQ